MKPFLKWVGGKQRLLPELQKYIPETYNTYFEPFVGAGALFFHLKPQKAYVSDLNQNLVDTYLGIKNDPEKVIEIINTYPNEPEAFCKIRDSSPVTQEERAAWMLYVNKCGFNGLYRVNKNGKCNVAFGKRKRPTYDFDNLREVSKFLQNSPGIDISQGNYKKILPLVKSGDFVYLDPPYYGTFTGYTAETFKDSDLQDLVAFVDDLVAKGAKVLVSNSNHEHVREAFQHYQIIQVHLTWVVSGKSKGIKKGDTELLIKTW